ncbi:hypothetical protein C8J57DRAFT_1595707 [Mycena rebaudengoi]|nr:hypothetical protein C8J57DRAFT_1595707 [Mycena rebaudengoi]
MSAVTTIMVGMALGNFLYGIYFNLFATSTYLLVTRINKGKSFDIYRSMLFLSGTTLYLTVTANAVLITVRIFQGFILFDEGPAVFFNDNRQPTALDFSRSILSANGTTSSPALNKKTSLPSSHTAPMRFSAISLIIIASLALGASAASIELKPRAEELEKRPCTDPSGQC